MKRKGSITVFLVFMLTCIFSAVFAFLEAARVSGLRANAEVSAIQACDTVLASYDRKLWEQYHLMFWNTNGDDPDLDSLKYLQQSAIAGNCLEHIFPEKNYFLLQVTLGQVQIQKYELATDHDGAVFQRQAAEMMRKTVGEDTLKTIMNWLDSSSGNDETDLEEKALGALEELEEARGQTDNGNPEAQESVNVPSDSELSEDRQTVSAAEISENPLEWVKMIQKKGIYAFLMPDKEISQKTVDLSTCVGRRKLAQGTYVSEEKSSGLDKLLFRLYLDKYFQDASEETEDHTLDYELEYILIGKAEDEANLKGTVRRLLLMREATNLLYLETDTEKRQQAAAIAMVIVSAAGHPELEPVVEQGILAAWAYAESLSDVKILLNGGKVMPVKTKEQWHTDIFHLSSSFSQAEDAHQDQGLSYSNYLQLLLWTQADRRLAERGMDIIEKNLDIKMDQMLSRAQCSYIFEAPAIFWDFVTLGEHSVQTYQLEEDAEISFYPRSE